MAINTNATQGVQITSSAKNGTLGTQTINNNQIDFGAAITVSNNGNLESSPDYIGRLVTIRAGAGDEETRYVTSLSSGTTYNVHEDWVSNPTSGDTYHVWYIIQDAATVTGLGLINKRVADYSSSRRFRILSGGYFCMVDGVSLETVDNGSTTVADFIVESGGRFQNGYLAGDTPVSGGYLIGTPATNGELVFDSQAGAITNLYDFFITCVFQNQIFLNSDVNIVKGKFFSGSYTMDLTGTATTDLLNLQDITIEGKGTTNDTIQINQYTTIDRATIISTNGFIMGTPGETVELRDVLFTDNNLRYCEVANNSAAQMDFVNPTWNPNTTVQVAGGGDIDFIDSGAGANGTVRELFELNITAQFANGDPASSARVDVYEGTGNNIPNTGTINSIGQFTDDILQRTFVPAGNATHITTTSYSDHAIRVTNYGQLTFLQTLDNTKQNDIFVTLQDDTAITNTSQSDAKTNGAGITVEQPANTAYVFHYDGGTGTVPTVGETITITNAGTDTTGALVEYIGDATEGYMVLENWNQVTGDNNGSISGSTSGVAALADISGGGASFSETYSWLIDGNSLAMTAIYDYIQAEFANATLSATFSDAVEWGQDEQESLLYLGPSGYFTERNVTKQEGVWIANRGAGTLDYLTSDNGTQFIPPAQYTFTLNGLQSGSEIRIYDTDPNANPRESIAGTESSGTSFGYTYTYNGDVSVYVVIFHLNYKEVRLTGLTLSSANQTIPIQQQLDRNYVP